jgi:lipopolysaccharide export system permease protein
MLIVDRYILVAVISSILLVVAVLLALTGLITFVGQLDNVGKGDFGIEDAVSFVLLVLPQRAFEFMPVASLLGTLLGLSRLAAHSELIVLRAAGFTPFRLAMSVLSVGALIAVFNAALGEFIAPPLEYYAEQQRALAKFPDLNISAEQNIWLMHEGFIINATPRSERDWGGGVYLFDFDDDRDLTSIGRADSATLGADDRWTLRNIVETRLGVERLEASTEQARTLSEGISPELIRFSDVYPDNMTGRDLSSYIEYLRENDLDTTSYEIAFWNRVAGPVAIILMTLLAMPFAYRFQRESGTNVKMAIGVIIGLIYFLASRTLANSGQVFDIDPMLIAWAPSLALAIVTGVGLSRLR